VGGFSPGLEYPQIAKDHDQIRHLQQAEAEAMALVLAHEGRIETIEKRRAREVEVWVKAAERWKEAYDSASQRCAELERDLGYARMDTARFKELYEAADQHPYISLRELRDFISEAWGREGEKTLDTLRRVKEGREELKKWEEIKAHGKQIAKEMEEEQLAGRWFVGFDHASDVTDPADYVEVDGVCVKADDIPTWAREDDPGDLNWARHMVCALIRWSLNLQDPKSTTTDMMLRGNLESVLTSIDSRRGREAKK
jgi:hypothetical protein